MTQVVKADGTMEGMGPVWVLDSDGRARINAHLLDGYHAGTGAGEVLVLDGAGDVPLDNLPATLTGKDADTVDGLHADATGAASAHVVATDASGDAKVVDLTVSGGLNLGTATGAGTGQVFLKTTNWPVLKVERSTTAITDAQGGLYLLATTSGNMVDGFGTEFHFVIRDSAGVDNDIARLQAIRAGADNSGALTFGVKNAGSWVEAFRAVPSGRVLIGTTSDDGVNRLQVNGSVKATYAEMNWLQILDGVAAPATVAGWARIYVDSADGDLKIKFGNGTVKTIVTD